MRLHTWCLAKRPLPVLHLTPTRVTAALLCQGPGNNDRVRSERAINVATSLPFVAVGLCTLR